MYVPPRSSRYAEVPGAGNAPYSPVNPFKPSIARGAGHVLWKGGRKERTIDEVPVDARAPVIIRSQPYGPGQIPAAAPYDPHPPSPFATVGGWGGSQSPNWHTGPSWYKYKRRKKEKKNEEEEEEEEEAEMDAHSPLDSQLYHEAGGNVPVGGQAPSRPTVNASIQTDKWNDLGEYTTPPAQQKPLAPSLSSSSDSSSDERIRRGRSPRRREPTSPRGTDELYRSASSRTTTRSPSPDRRSDNEHRNGILDDGQHPRRVPSTTSSASTRGDLHQLDHSRASSCRHRTPCSGQQGTACTYQSSSMSPRGPLSPTSSTRRSGSSRSRSPPPVVVQEPLAPPHEDEITFDFRLNSHNRKKTINPFAKSRVSKISTLPAKFSPHLHPLFGASPSTAVNQPEKGGLEDMQATTSPADAQLTWFAITASLFLDVIPRQVYLYFLLGFPALYWSRVTRIFHDANLGMSEIKRMALEAASSDDGMQKVMLYQGIFPQESTHAPVPYENLRNSWHAFIELLMREWKTFNIITVLLLSWVEPSNVSNMLSLTHSTAPSSPSSRFHQLLPILSFAMLPCSRWSAHS